MAFSNIFFLALMWLELCFIYYVGDVCMPQCSTCIRSPLFFVHAVDPLPSPILHQILLPRCVHEIEEKKILPVIFFLNLFDAPWNAGCGVTQKQVFWKIAFKSGDSPAPVQAETSQSQTTVQTEYVALSPTWKYSSMLLIINCMGKLHEVGHFFIKIPPDSGDTASDLMRSDCSRSQTLHLQKCARLKVEWPIVASIYPAPTLPLSPV